LAEADLALWTGVKNRFNLFQVMLKSKMPPNFEITFERRAQITDTRQLCYGYRYPESEAKCHTTVRI